MEVTKLSRWRLAEESLDRLGKGAVALEFLDRGMLVETLDVVEAPPCYL